MWVEQIDRILKICVYSWIFILERINVQIVIFPVALLMNRWSSNEQVIAIWLLRLAFCCSKFPCWQILNWPGHYLQLGTKFLADGFSKDWTIIWSCTDEYLIPGRFLGVGFSSKGIISDCNSNECSIPEISLVSGYSSDRVITGNSLGDCPIHGILFVASQVTGSLLEAL